MPESSMRDENLADAGLGAAQSSAWRGGLFSQAALLGGATLVVKFAALAKDWLVARQLGAGDALDAFLIAFLVITYAVAVLGNSFASAFMPVYVRTWQQQGLGAARRLTNNVLGAGSLLMLAATLLVTLVGYVALPALALGFDDEKLALARTLLLLQAGAIWCSGVSSMLAAVLNAHQRFAEPALAALAIPLGTLVVFGLGGERFGVSALATGTMVGFALETVVMTLLAARGSLIGRPRWHPREAGLRQVGTHYWPMVASALLMSSSLLVDQSMAASLGPGQLSVLSYGGKVISVVLAVLAVSSSTVLFPRFAQLVAAGRRDELRRAVRWCVVAVVLGSVPGLALLAIVNTPLVRLLFERGAFTPETTAAVAAVQLCLLGQIPFYVLNMIGTRLLSALEGNRLVLVISVVNLAVNVVGNYVLMRMFGVRGIALATSLVYLVAAGCTFWAVRVRLREVSAT